MITKIIKIALVISIMPACSFGMSTRQADEISHPLPKVVLPDESEYKIAPADGKGTVTVSPASVVSASPVTLTFTFTASENGIAPGGGVVCMVSNFWGWTRPQVNSPDRGGYFTVTPGDPDIDIKLISEASGYAVFARIGEKPLKSGQTLTFVYGDTQSGKFPNAAGRADIYAERGERFFFRVDGDGDGFYVPIENQPYFHVQPLKPFKLSAYGPSRVSVGKPFEIALSILDRADNLVESFEGKIQLTAIGCDTTIPAEVTFRAENLGTLRVSATAQTPGIILIGAADPSEKLKPVDCNPIVVADTGAEQLKLYWADLHGHSNFSDGTALPKEYFRYARDVAGLDIAALTDHDNWGYEPLYKSQKNQQIILDVVEEFHQPGNFVTIAGYEWTNWTYGHMHILFKEPDETLVVPWSEPSGQNPKKLWQTLGKRDCITIPHHTGGGPIPYFWEYYDRRFMPVVEITSIHGVSEKIGHPQSIYSPVESGMVQSALARGYRLGILGSGDTHDGHPGIKRAGPVVSGIAGIYAKSLTRKDVFEAIRARRVYATTGCRSVLRFFMGSTPMGGVVRLTKAGEKREFTVKIVADAAISSITIVKNNKTVVVEPGDGAFMTWQWADTQPAQNGDYYYARIKQADGHWIFSSPIWIELD